MPPSRPTKERETKAARILANRYEIVKKLGSGNFGTAFLCKDKRINNELKVLKEISVSDLQPDETIDAMHEARLLSKLNHPGIVKFRDSFIDGEFFCIITEYCEGGDLDHKISDYKNAGKSFDEKTVMSWTIQLILAIQYIHSRRVLHRDLKTRNIFIRNNMMKIGDFGISRILLGTMDMASTFTGTPYYMSPEVLKHDGYNSKSDVWSIGCIIYELCSLEHAFMGQGLMAVMYKIVEKEPPDLPKKYTRDLDEVFKKMLTKDPEKRPSATEVTKLPYVARFMVKMKDVLTDEFNSKHVINPETAEREAGELANLLNEKTNLNELSSTPYKTTEEDESVDGAKPKLTARERMRLKKIQESDKRAQDLKQATRIQLVENTVRREKIKTSYEQTTLPAWKGGNGEGTILQEAINVRDPRLEKRSSQNYHDHQYDDSDEDEQTIRQQATYRKNSDQKSYTVGSDQLHRASSQKLSSTWKSQMSMTMPDDRPITPMQDLMVYNREHSSLDFKDGIPELPDLANTFYEQYEDFNDDDGDIVYGDEEEGDGTLVAQKDEEDFITYLERALNKDVAESTTLNDDTILGAYGHHAREIKINNLRGECVKIMGKEEFHKAYNYLMTARNSQDGKDKPEKEIMEGLRKYVKNPSDCFMVDQLLFLEEQAKHS